MKIEILPNRNDTHQGKVLIDPYPNSGYRCSTCKESSSFLLIDSSNDERNIIIVCKFCTTTNAKSVLIYGVLPGAKGYLKVIFELSERSLYKYSLFRVEPDLFQLTFESEYVYMNWRTANELLLNKSNHL